jgi:tetratricopeptide (TPR) repeat protein
MSLLRELYGSPSRSPRPASARLAHSIEISPVTLPHSREDAASSSPKLASFRLSSKGSSPALLARTLSHSPLSGSFSSLIAKLSPGRSPRKRTPSKDLLVQEFACDNPMFSLDDIDAESVTHDDIDDEPALVKGVRLACLQSLDVAGDATVGSAIAALVALGPEACAGRLSEFGGQADAVVVFDADMQWSDFVATLARADPARFLWIGGVCGALADSLEVTVLAVKRVELILPSWANIDALWSPENCRWARTDACFVVRATARDERGLVHAANHGLPLSFFDSMLNPAATIGPRVVRALRLWACNLLDTAAAKNQIEPAMRHFAMGHVHCAAKSFDEAIRYYEAARDADGGMNTILAAADIGETLRRARRLPEAAAAFQGLVRENIDEAHAAVFYMYLGNVLMDQDEFVAAQGAFQVCLANYAKHFGPQSEKAALAHCALAKALAAQLLWTAAREHLETALGVRRELRQQSKVAETLSSLGAILVHEGNQLHALRMHTEAMEVASKVWGPAHPLTLECMLQSAVVHLALNDTNDALELLRTVVNKRLDLFGQHDERTLAAIHNLVLVYNQRGDFAKSRPLLEQILQAQQRQFGPESAQVSKTLKEMVCVMVASRGKWD